MPNGPQRTKTIINCPLYGTDCAKFATENHEKPPTKLYHSRDETKSTNIQDVCALCYIIKILIPICQSEAIPPTAISTLH